MNTFCQYGTFLFVRPKGDELGQITTLHFRIIGRGFRRRCKPGGASIRGVVPGSRDPKHQLEEWTLQAN